MSDEGYVYTVDDADDVKWDLIPEGNWYLVDINKREASRSKNSGNQMVKFYFRVISKYPKVNNTEINMWLTFSERAMRVGKAHIRGVLGDDAMVHGSSISWETILTLTEKMEWASYPLVGDEIGEKRQMLALVGNQENPPYQPQNVIKKLKAVPEIWEEEDIDGLDESDMLSEDELPFDEI